MIKYKFTDSGQNNKIISELAEKAKLSFETTAVLYSRGMDTLEKINGFLTPGKARFINPMLLKGMPEAVCRLKKAKENNESVLVYGDYDADGICATTILYYALKKFGIENVEKVVPERSDGYGLQNQVINSIYPNNKFNLLVTVDCGISCCKEVEDLKRCGVDVIVTDHHELPEKLPDCIIVNCKIPSEYEFEYLCGAGVAFKLAFSLIGELAYNFLDFVTIATIADSMPLIGENRDLVFEGINFIKSGKAHAAVYELIAISNMKEITSTGIAYTIAPRINAAGRMGDAKSALQLMTTDNNELIESLAIKLNAYNIQRQNECEMLYATARKKLIDSAYNKKIVVLEDDAWNGGLVGIIAAKLVEEFSRPVILFVNNEGKLHGSARSIDSINIFEAISSCKEYLTDFGGHAQAAGISLDIENFEAFKNSLENFVDKNYNFDTFKPVKTVEMEINKTFTLNLAKEIQLLEPFGTGNKKPLFVIKCDSIASYPLKNGSSHLAFKTDYIDMLYFNGISSQNLINSGMEKRIVFEPNISIFNHEESLKGYVKDIEFIINPTKRIVLSGFREGLLTALNDNDNYQYISPDMTKKLISSFSKENYGTLFALYNIDNLNSYTELNGLDLSLYTSSNRNLVNNIVLGLNELEINDYKQIVYLDRPLGAVPNFKGISNVFIDRKVYAYDYKLLDTTKETFAKLFHFMRESKISAEDSVSFALKAGTGFCLEQVVFALEVFIELGIFYFKNGYLRYNSEVRSSLSSSKIYAEVEKLK